MSYIPVLARLSGLGRYSATLPQRLPQVPSSDPGQAGRSDRLQPQPRGFGGPRQAEDGTTPLRGARQY